MSHDNCHCGHPRSAHQCGGCTIQQTDMTATTKCECEGFRAFVYGDIIEVIEGEYQDMWGYYDNDDFTEEEYVVVIIVDAVGGTSATEGLLAGHEIYVPGRYCRKKETVEPVIDSPRGQ
jgi:hypothetical protein